MGSYRLLFQIALLSSLIGLLLSLLRCPESYPSLQQQRVTAHGLSGFRSRLRCHLSDISSLLTRGTRVLFILLFCFTTTNLGIFAFWALYAEYHFHWTISQISASLLLMTIVTATSQRFVLPTLLPRVGSIRLLQIMLLSTIIYPLLLGIANQVAFAMLPLFNIIGFSGSSLIQGELSRQQDQDRQGLVASQFGVITGAGTLLSVTLSGLLAWLVNSLGMANGPLSGSPFFVLSVIPIACWWYVKGDINEALSSTPEG
jgi:predicted MFS family arabinose efflux permease